MIELLRKEHFDDVYELAIEFCANSPYSNLSVDKETLFNTLDFVSNLGLSFVYVHEGKCVGVILGMTAPAWFNSSIVNAMELMWWVSKNHRGVGWMLKDAYENAASEKKISYVGLATLSSSGISDKLNKDGYIVTETAWIKEI